MANTIKRREQNDGTTAKGKTKKEKLKKLLVHQSNGFSMYRIPPKKEMGGKEEAYYNASCELGSGTEWCTATGKTTDYFDYYTKGGALFIFINDGASDEKFQYSPSANQFMDTFDDDILQSSSAPVILSYLKGGLEWIEKNEPGGIGLDVKMAMGTPPKDIKKDLNKYFKDTDDEWIEELWEHVLEDYLKEAAEGKWDSNSVVQKYFKDNSLSPYNVNNWLEVLKISQNVFEGFSKYTLGEIMAHLASIYRLGDLLHPTKELWVKPYFSLIFEEVIKKGIDSYLIDNTIDFDYKGDL